MITISADYEVKTAASDTSKLKNEVLKIEEKISSVNSQLSVLNKKQEACEEERMSDM